MPKHCRPKSTVPSIILTLNPPEINTFRDWQIIQSEQVVLSSLTGKWERAAAEYRIRTGIFPDLETVMSAFSRIVREKALTSKLIPEVSHA
jgi:hypothetical protein